MSERNGANKPDARYPPPHAPVPTTTSPALDPPLRVCVSPSSSSATSTPGCAKKWKNPDDIASEKGASESQFRSVGAAKAIRDIA